MYSMNILAHLYLSKGINQLMLGNFIGDFVKGNQHAQYPSEVQQGILLHRNIDTFTDKHPIHKQSRDKFRPKYGLFSGVVIDILYDHFLAKNWNSYSKESLQSFSQKAYAYISANENVLPEKLKVITPHMINNDWISLYESISGIERVLRGMASRTSLPDHVTFAICIINKDYDLLENEFKLFFKDLKSYIDI